jgi:hypothetical protein
MKIMNSKKQHGQARFEHFLQQLELLLKKASRQKNPALWLYQNDARTVLFMLEGLAKLYAGIHCKKKFVKLELQFKQLEDALGAIDYYDTFGKQFSTNKRISYTVISYLQAQTREKIQSFDEMLREGKWIGSDNKRITKIRKTLKKADWLKEKAEIKKIEEFYEAAIVRITQFVDKENFHFENIESDVHALRRKLRWLSIYPKGLLGAIQLGKTKKIPKQLSKYITKQETDSPFNKMPDAGDNQYFLLLEQNHFYALSWMIAELGRIKDSGLAVLVIKEALQQTSPVSDAAAFKKAYQSLGKGQLTLRQLLDKADGICKTYFAQKNLDELLIGIAAVK